MYITYHKEVSIPEPESSAIDTIPHIVLSNKIQDFIEARGVKQERYYCYENGYYFFIYLDNGDRIDCSLAQHTHC